MSDLNLRVLTDQLIQDGYYKEVSGINPPNPVLIRGKERIITSGLVNAVSDLMYLSPTGVSLVGAVEEIMTINHNPFQVRGMKPEPYGETLMLAAYPIQDDGFSQTHKL